MAINNRIPSPPPSALPLRLAATDVQPWQCWLPRSQPPILPSPLSAMEELLGDG